MRGLYQHEMQRVSAGIADQNSTLSWAISGGIVGLGLGCTLFSLSCYLDGLPVVFFNEDWEVRRRILLVAGVLSGALSAVGLVAGGVVGACIAS